MGGWDPGGTGGRCEASFFERGSDAGSVRPALHIKLVDANDPNPDAPYDFTDEAWKASKDLGLDGFGRMVYRALIKDWSYFVAIDIFVLYYFNLW